MWIINKKKSLILLGNFFCKPYIFKHVKNLFYLHLSIRTDLSQDLPDLGLEAHVQHPVGLVQNNIGATPEVCLVHLKTASTLYEVPYLPSTCTISTAGILIFKL
jgi:hypothetical protein